MLSVSFAEHIGYIVNNFNDFCVRNFCQDWRLVRF